MCDRGWILWEFFFYWNYALANITLLRSAYNIRLFKFSLLCSFLARIHEHSCVIQSTVGWRVCLQSGVQPHPSSVDQSHTRPLWGQTGEPSGDIHSCFIHYCSEISLGCVENNAITAQCKNGHDILIIVQ